MPYASQTTSRKEVSRMQVKIFSSWSQLGDIEQRANAWLRQQEPHIEVRDIVLRNHGPQGHLALLITFNPLDSYVCED